jgi:hypothetical protein
LLKQIAIWCDLVSFASKLAVENRAKKRPKPVNLETHSRTPTCLFALMMLPARGALFLMPWLKREAASVEKRKS